MASEAKLPTYDDLMANAPSMYDPGKQATQWTPQAPATEQRSEADVAHEIVRLNRREPEPTASSGTAASASSDASADARATSDSGVTATFDPDATGITAMRPWTLFPIGYAVVVAWVVIVCASFTVVGEKGSLVLGCGVFPLVVPATFVLIVVLLRRAGARLLAVDEAIFVVFVYLLFAIPAVIIAAVFVPVWQGSTTADLQWVGAVPVAAPIVTDKSFVRFTQPPAINISLGGLHLQRISSKSGGLAAIRAFPITAPGSQVISAWACTCALFSGCRFYPGFNFTFGLGARAFGRHGYNDGMRIRSKAILPWCRSAARNALAFNNATVALTPGAPVSSALFVEITSFPRAAAKLRVIVLAVVLSLMSIPTLLCCGSIVFGVWLS